MDHLPIGGCKFLLPVNPVDEFGHFLVVPAFFNKGFQVVVTGRVEQAKTGKVALGSELLGSCGKEQNGGKLLSEAFHDLVGGAGELGCPFEVMGFVDNQQVPLLFQYLGVALVGGG